MTPPPPPTREQGQRRPVLPSIDNLLRSITEYNSARTSAFTSVDVTTPIGLASNQCRRLCGKDALVYLDQVMDKSRDRPEIYIEFLNILSDFNSRRIDVSGVIDRVSRLFEDYPTLLTGFYVFLPPNYQDYYMH
ncbi:Paired amphipathic helix protein Sin3b [Lobosporangium transversale]|uniref:Paired amphipathic helix n=1 Tax=Lobosporangium transversale TaxID=64571 RepID=A0A1Y2GDL6_9FUNG|nr:hypothetical protein BCR41DRAFT_400874 [Lobosporangium transversale]KAF9905511.1 Paired amphipathic helix protein Sin3b [Lobosporangium transversale]ORZ04856.1 hypothetical protein BCR41DRAFT_400874 [Lobosporangium transversale]|eukprot:XP_021876793.1 hypothetical protein BCR41DRAFT_400874 [Lobosporangium transversale]